MTSNGLDDLHLGGADIGQDDVELGLLLLNGSGSAGSGNGSGGHSGNAELLAVSVDELLQLQDGQALDGLDDGGDLLRSHGNNPPVSVDFL